MKSENLTILETSLMHARLSRRKYLETPLLQISRSAPASMLKLLYRIVKLNTVRVSQVCFNRPKLTMRLFGPRVGPHDSAHAFGIRIFCRQTDIHTSLVGQTLYLITTLGRVWSNSHSKLVLHCQHNCIRCRQLVLIVGRCGLTVFCTQ